MKIVYVEVKASDELPKVPGYYNVRSIHDPYGRFTQAEYEEGVSDSGWKLSYVWLKKVELPTEEEIEKEAGCNDHAMASMAEAVWGSAGFIQGAQLILNKLN